MRKNEHPNVSYPEFTALGRELSRNFPRGSRLLQAEGGRSWMVERRWAVQRESKGRQLR